MMSVLERQVVLVGVDRLVLGAVIGEDALDVAHPADRPDVGEEDSSTRITPSTGFHRSGLLRRRASASTRLVSQHGQQDEEHDGEHAAEHHRDRDLLAGELLLLGVAGKRCRDRERLHRERKRLDERDAAAHDRPAHPAVLRGSRGQVVLLGVDRPVGRAHGDGPVELAAHHDAFEDGLAADMGVGHGPVDCGQLCGGISHVWAPSGRGRRRSSCPRGTRRDGRTHPRP